MSIAVEIFDPYREWLGIEPQEFPVDHYRLLGLPRFESDVARIQSAADQRMALIRSNQTGPRGSHAHKLLNELSAAKLCLLSPAAKVQYDKTLSEHFSPLAAAHFAAESAGIRDFPASYAAYQALAPALEPPLAPPPITLLATVAAPPKQARKSEHAVDVDKPAGEEITEARSPRLRVIVVMFIATLLIAGGIWGAGKLFAPGETNVTVTSPQGQPATEAGKTDDPAAKATLVLQEGSGELNLPPAAAALSGATTLKTAISENVITGWASADDAATWKFKLLRPGFFRLELSYAAADERNGISLELLLNGEPLHKFHLQSTGDLDKFDTHSHTIVVKSSGTHSLVLRPIGQVAENSLGIKSIHLEPVGGKP